MTVKSGELLTLEKAVEKYLTDWFYNDEEKVNYGALNGRSNWVAAKELIALIKYYPSTPKAGEKDTSPIKVRPPFGDYERPE